MARFKIESIEDTMPSGPEGVTLQLAPGAPVFELIRTVHDATARPSTSIMAAFVYRFPIPD